MLGVASGVSLEEQVEMALTQILRALDHAP